MANLGISTKRGTLSADLSWSKLMKRKLMIVFTVIFALIAVYALYSVIGYTVTELKYPVLRAGETSAYFGGNLIMLGVAGGVLLLSGSAFSVLLYFLLRGRRKAASASEEEEEQKAA